MIRVNEYSDEYFGIFRWRRLVPGVLRVPAQDRNQFSPPSSPPVYNLLFYLLQCNRHS
jgi:hypothetical protein